MLIRTHIDQNGNAWVKITDGKQLINMHRSESRNPCGSRDTVEIAVLACLPGSDGGELAAGRIRMMFNKMDKEIAIVQKLLGSNAVVVPHAKFCSRTHPSFDNGCDRILDPLKFTARK